MKISNIEKQRTNFKNDMLCKFIYIFKGTLINRKNVDGCTDAIFSLADIVLYTFDNPKDAEVEFLENRWPQLWFRIKNTRIPDDTEVIIITNTMGSNEKNIGLLIKDSDNSFIISGTAKRISKYLKKFISGKGIPVKPYRIKPYTQFFATLETTLSRYENFDLMSEHLKDITESKIGDYIEMPLTEEQNKRFSKFTQWLADRQYYAIITSIKQTSQSKFIFTLLYRNQVELVFDCDDVGETGIKSILMLRDNNEYKVRIIDNPRVLECAINENTLLNNEF